MATVSSPCKASGSAVTLPVRGGGEGHLLIRVADDDPTNKIIWRIGGTVSATKAGGFLNGGDAVTIRLDSIPNNDIPISILSVTNDPDIYWSYI